MGPLVPLLVVVVLIGLAFWAGRMSAGAPTTPVVADPRAPRELAERDAFIEQLRELAWQHRDVSPELSTIIIDEITTHHRRLSGGPDA
ncbi:MAG TPA: hypothetical protein VGD39_09500 [Nocardioides sp.]